MKNQTKKTTRLAQLSLLLALQIILAFTPLGFIAIPPIAVTILHIPVIVGSLLLGAGYGAFLGAVFGILSMIKASMGSVSPIDMLFSPIASGFPLQSIVLSMAPRMILGMLPPWLDRGLSKVIKREGVSLGLSAALSTACHTILVLGLLWVFFKSIPFQTIFLAVVSLNGTIEIALAVILSVAICLPLRRYLGKNS